MRLKTKAYVYYAFYINEDEQKCAKHFIRVTHWHALPAGRLGIDAHKEKNKMEMVMIDRHDDYK